MSKCTQCPHVVGDSYQRDCAFPDCMGWHIEKNVKPISDSRHNYDFWHDDYGSCGTARSMIDAMEQIAEIERKRS